jgi:hypothetical protein
MAAIGKVSAIFTANASGLVTGVNQASAAMRKMQTSVSSLGGGIRSLVAIQGAQLFGSIASSATGYVRSLVSMGQAQADVIDSQSKLAARLGMTYGEFAGLSLAGDLAGVGMDSIAAAATKADVAFIRASNGSKEAAAGFGSLGLSLEELGGMSSAERFQAIAQAISALPSEAERSAAAVALFGRAGAELLPLFSGGAEGIAQAVEQADRFGLALTTAQGQDVEAMNDAFTLAGKAIEGIVTQVVAYLAPAVQAVADTFTSFVGSIGGANIGQAIGDGIIAGARFLAGIGDWLITNLSGVWQYVSEVGVQWASVVDFLNRVSSIVAGVFSAAQALFLGIIGGFNAAVLGLASIAQQIGKFLRFDTSSLDEVVAGSEAFASNINAQIVESGAASAAAFQNAFAETAQPIGQAVAGPLTTALDAAVAQAEASAASVSQAGAGAASRITEAAAAAVEPQALKGVDSRSSEGVAEMFRIMRGTGGDVQERQLGVLERIADAVEGQEADPAFPME